MCISVVLILEWLRQGHREGNIALIIYDATIHPDLDSFQPNFPAMYWELSSFCIFGLGSDGVGGCSRGLLRFIVDVRISFVL